MKALFDSQLYLKNPNATEAAAARLQAQVLDSISCIANGQPAVNSSESSLTTEDTPHQMSEKSPTSTNDEKKKKKTSPAVAMAEASLLSQKAAAQEQDSFKAMLDLQKERKSAEEGRGKDWH